MAPKTAYQLFDEAMIAAGKEPAPGGHKAIVERLGDLAEKLPQFPAIQAINPAQHLNWARRALVTELTVSMMDRGMTPKGDVLDAADEEDYDRAWKQCLWHLRRASGIGGSEIGTIVLNVSRQQTGDFGSAHNTVKEKLLMMAPQIGEPAMRRGHKLEEMVRNIHHQTIRNGVREVEDVRSLETLRGFRSPDHPYIIGTPDDITLRVVAGKKERVLVDYKCPSEEMMKKYLKEGVPFGYKAQLLHYRIVAEDAGIKINALQLVPFNYHGGATAEVLPVTYDAALEQEIKQTAKMVWEDFVMRGRVPDQMRPGQLRAEAPEVGEAMRRAGVMHAIADSMQKRAQEFKKDAILIADASIERKALGRIDAGFYYISRDAEWDEEELRALASKAGVNPDDFVRPSPTKVNQKSAAALLGRIRELTAQGGAQAAREIASCLKSDTAGALVMETDLDAMAKSISEKGVDVSYAYVVKERAGLTMKRAGEDAEAKAVVLGRAEDLINEITHLVDTQIERFMDDPEPENEDYPPDVSF